MPTLPAETDVPHAPAPNGSPPPTPPRREGGLRSTLLVSAMTLASRLLGLVREMLFAALLGAGTFADAFVVAFRIPNLLRDLFAEGALSAAFIPTFARVEKEQGDAAAWQLANRVVGAVLLLVGLLTMLGILFAKQIVLLLAPGFATVPGKVELTAQLAQLMMPFLLVLSLAAVAMGMLNARARFSAPALAPAMFNVASIAVGLGLKLAGAAPQTAVVGWSIGTLLGGIAQFGVQLPPLWREGFRLRPKLAGVWRDESVRRIARLMGPATLGLAATEANIFINTRFASTEPAANAWLSYAFRLMYVPIGLFGVAVATVTASSLARKAAEKDLSGLKERLGVGLRHVAFLTVPSTVGLVLLAEPIISLLYQHGRFTPIDTQKTAVALMGYAIGLYAYSGVKVVAPAFYALDHARVPLVGSSSAVAVNLVFNLALYHTVGYVGLAIGISLGALLNLVILTLAFRRFTREAQAPSQGIFRQLVQVIVASALMGAVVWGALDGLDWLLRSGGVSFGALWARMLRALLGVGVGAVAYAVACKLLRVRELEELLEAFRRRRRRTA